MTLQQLKYADAVAACGSISEAARRCFVTQPTLTEAMRLLEEELRIAIFTRSPKGVSLTREGEEFLASARQILDDAARISEKYTGKAVRRLNTSEDGRFNPRGAYPAQRHPALRRRHFVRGLNPQTYGSLTENSENDRDSNRD